MPRAGPRYRSMRKRKKNTGRPKGSTKAETASLLSKIEKYEKQAARQAESCAVLEEKAAAYDRLLEDVGREMRSKPDTYRSEAGGIQRQPASQDEKQRPCRSSRQKKDGIVRVFRRLMENDRDI